MPTTTTGLATSFIQFSRASNATTTLSNGRIGWAGHNLLLASESFDSSSWTKTTTTVAANSHAAPNSTTTAETLTASSANGTTLQSYTALAVSYTFGVWLKRKTGTGNIQIAADSGTYTTVTITSDWALYTVTQTPAAGTISAGIRIVTSGDEVYAWGAHLYRSDMQMQANPAMGAGMGSYYPTTPRNLLGYTEDWSNAAWTKTNILAFGSGSISNAIVAPNGLQTADLIVPNTTSGVHYTYLVGAGTIADKSTHSVYVKPAGYTKIGIREGLTSGACVSFNLTGSGSSLTAFNAGGVTSSNQAVTAVGDGWYRISVTFSGGACNRMELWVLPDSFTGGDVNTSWTPDGTSGIYLWGAQLSDSASLDTYVPQYGAAVTSAAYYAPRLDFDGATLSPRGLLVEEQRTNRIRNSNAFDDATWDKVACSVDANSSGTLSPSGLNDAELLTASSSASFAYIYSTTGSTVATPFAVSVYIKSNTQRYVQFLSTSSGNWYANFDLQTGTGSPQGTASSATATSVGNGWYRCTAVVTDANASDFALGFVTSISAARAENTTLTTSVYIWGAQVETGSFPTSLIVTGASTATRTADVADVSTQAFPYSVSGSSLVAAFSRLTASVGGAAVSLGGTSSGTANSIVLDAANTGYLRAFSEVAGSIPYIQSTLATYTANTVQKSAVGYAENNANGAANGTAGTADTSCGVPVVDLLSIGAIRNSSSAASVFLNGHIRQITYIPRRLTDAELASRTAA